MLPSGCLLLFLGIAKVVIPIHAAECECGKAPRAEYSMRIVGGRTAEPHSFPWTVAIMKDSKMHCGGALVTNKHILGAGHCYKWDNIMHMEVLIGLDSMLNLQNVARRNITNAVIHEQFTSTAVRDENDIAVATIDRPVQFSDTIVPVCLPTPGQHFGGWLGTIVGWGRVSAEGTAANVLMKATLKILNNEDCQASKLAEHLKPSMMCAYSKGKDGCQGDSGGPLLVLSPEGKYLQAGIVSWGIGCADPRYPGVYTKVSDYIDWIQDKIKDGDTCE